MEVYAVVAVGAYCLRPHVVLPRTPADGRWRWGGGSNAGVVHQCLRAEDVGGRRQYAPTSRTTLPDGNCPRIPDTPLRSSYFVLTPLPPPCLLIYLRYSPTRPLAHFIHLHNDVEV